MDSQKSTEFGALKNIDIFDPSIFFALTVAVVGDMTFWLVVTRWVAAIFVGFLLFPKMTGFLPKLILGAALILALIPFLPIPVLMVGILLAVVLSNKLIEYTVIAAILVAEAAAALTGVGAVADVAVDAAATAAKEAGEKLVEKGAEKVAEKVVQKGAEKVVEKGAQKVAEKGVKEVAKEGAKEVAKKETKKTVGQKVKEYGKKKIKEKLEDRRDELGKELFNKDKDETSRDDDAFTGSGESQVEPIVDLRSGRSADGLATIDENEMDRAA